MKVYGDLKSGNCYKVKLLLNQLNVQHECGQERYIGMDAHQEIAR